MLQTRTGGKWKQLQAKKTNSRGKVTFRLTIKAGSHSYRLKARATKRAKAAITPSKTVRGIRPGTPPTQPQPPTDPESPWQLAYSEDFDQLDSKVWNVANSTYLAHEDSHLWARNVTTEEGKLRIQAKREETTVGRTTRQYTSGYINSNGKYSFPNYFKVEVRARVPLEQGMWAAPLWLRPLDGSGGEIDLIETYGNRPTRYNHTIHTAYGENRQQKHIQGTYRTDPLAWHTYTLEKTPGQIKMWIDGEHTATFKSGDPSWYDTYYEADKRWVFRINLQVGGKWGGLPDQTTDWTPHKTAMEVAYLKAWVPAG